MANSIRSHIFVVGNLQNKIDVKALENSNWTKVIEDETTYNFLCSYFHKSHVDAMIEAKGQQRPKFLNDVHHYRLNINANIPLSIFNSARNNLMVLDGYKLNIISLHVYCMPLNITLYAVEIDDSGSDLNDLTLAHLYIRDFPSRWEQFNDDFKQALDPIKVLCPGGEPKNLVTSGNKLKIFQILMVDKDEWSDEHLYEIGTCSPIDIVNTSHHLAPSQEYYSDTIKKNCLAPFTTWKSLSLMDSFTTLIKCEGEFKEGVWMLEKTKWINSYYRFIFLRVLMQKAFLSTQNIKYRLNHSNSNVVRDLARMEQYYFYDNISYNFLPDMLNKQMENGMAINEEREELSAQVKEWDDKRNNTLMGILSIFAIFSVSNDTYQLMRDLMKDSLLLLCIISSLTIICIVFLLVRLIRRG